MAIKVRFALRGKSFELTREDFENAVQGVEPEQIQKYSTVVNNVRYPIRQVLSAGTGIRKIDFTTSDANRLLQRFGFKIDVEEEVRIAENPPQHLSETKGEFSSELRQRKLIKPVAQGTVHRTITIEDRTANDGYRFHVKIGDSTVPKNTSGFGLQDPTKRTPAIQVSTPQILRVDTIEDAVEFARKEFQRSVEHEHFTPLPTGEDFPPF